MKRKFMMIFAIIAIMMMAVGCPQNTNTDNGNQTPTESAQTKQNKATSGIAANMTISGVIENTTCDIVLDAATATWTATESRSKSFAGEFFYDNGKLQLKVTKKDEVELQTAQQIYLKSDITESELKDQTVVTLTATTKEVYEEAKTEYRKSVESVSGSSFTVVLEDIPAEAKAVALFCNQNEWKIENVNGSNYIAEVVNGKAAWTITNYQLSEPFWFQFTPMPSKDTQLGEDWWSYSISGSSTYANNKNNITCDFAKKSIEIGGFTITVNKTTYGSDYWDRTFPIYGVSSTRWFNESWKSCFTVK